VWITIALADGAIGRSTVIGRSYTWGSATTRALTSTACEVLLPGSRCR
jgi:hypothetical protein